MAIPARMAAVFLVAASALAQSHVPSKSLTAPTPPVGQRPSAVNVLLERSYVRAERVEVEPTKLAYVALRSGDALIISLGKSKFELDSGPVRSPLELDDGEMEVIKGAHEVLNNSGSTVRLVEVQVPRGIQPDHPLCGLGGPPCNGIQFGKTDAGTYSEGLLFETPTIKVLKAQLGPGGVLATHTDRNDHVLVPLTAADLDVDGESTQRKVGEAYLYTAGMAITNRGAGDAVFVVVELK